MIKILLWLDELVVRNTEKIKISTFEVSLWFAPDTIRYVILKDPGQYAIRAAYRKRDIAWLAEKYCKV